MKRNPFTLPAAAVGLVLSFSAAGADTMQQHAIQQTIDGMTAAFEAGDVPGILGHYTQGGVVVGAPGSPVSGTGPLADLFAQFIAVDPKFTFHAHDIVVAGDVAVHTSRWTMIGKDPEGHAVEDGGLSVAVLRRQPDGRWLIAIDNPYGGHLLQDR